MKTDNPIIDSILQNDLYKVTMQQAAFHQYPNAEVCYEFILRTEGVDLVPYMDEIWQEIKAMSALSLSLKEKCYLESLSFIRQDYVQYLWNEFYYMPTLQVEVFSDPDYVGGIRIIIRGKWVDVIGYEVPILSIVNEVYFKNITNPRVCWKTGEIQLKHKIGLLKEYKRMVIAEFGTRRRYSAKWQDHVLGYLLENCPQVVGTSNISLAMKYGCKPIGTMAHEYISAHLGFVDNVREAQKRSLYVWLQEYGEDLGIALTDTFTTKAFFEDFGPILANAFSGVRHDSGDPIEFGHAMIAHYNELGIDPNSKTIVFSDGLDFPEAIRIFNEFTGLINISFGIGTNITNDVGHKTLNIVMKMVECNGIHVIKLSDVEGKVIGDEHKIREVREAYCGLPQEEKIVALA